MAYQYPLGINGDGLNSESPYRSRILFQAIEVERIRFDQKATKAFEGASWKDAIGFASKGLPSTDLTEVEKNTKEFVEKANGANLSSSPELNTNPIAGEAVTLYTPIAIQIDDRLEYNNGALGIGGAAAFNAVQSTGNLSAAAAQSLSQGVAGISDMVTGILGDGLGELGVVRATQTIGGLNENLQNAVSFAAQITVNPNLRTLFKGVQVRTFNFNFQFVPTSADEAKEVELIIDFFRHYAYPDNKTPDGKADLGSFGYAFPERFDIRVQHASADENWEDIKPKFFQSYLTNVSVTYNPTAAVYHEDGQPTQTNLSLAFSEYRSLNRKDVGYKPIKVDIETAQ